MNILIANLKPDSGSSSDSELSKRVSTLHFPIGLGIIAAVLRNSGVEYEVYDSYVNGTSDGFLQKVGNNKTDVILMSGFLGNYTYSFIKDITKKIKAIDRSIMIIIGGPIASTIPELLITRTSVDYVVKGEGENTITELLIALTMNSEVSSVKGIYFRDKLNNAVFTGDRSRIADLDLSPYPLYNVFPKEPYIDYLKDTGRCWEISTSRGCFNHCSFCKLTFGQKITYHSCSSVVNHMTHVLEEYGINRFSFVDDNFLNNPRRVEEFRDLLNNQPHKFKWRFQGRADRISPQVVNDLMEVGLYDISFGIESGSQKMLDQYNKRLDIKQAADNLRDIRNMIECHATFIVGGPGENWETVEETVSFIKKIKLKNTGIGILTLFPGTLLYNRAREAGMIEDEDDYCMKLGTVYESPYINVSDLTDSDLMKAKDLLLEAAAEFGVYS